MDLLFAVGLVSLNTVPVFATVVGVAFAIVIDYEVVLVQALPNNLLVSILVDFVVKIVDLVRLVAVECLLARLAQGLELLEPGSVILPRHDIWCRQQQVKIICVAERNLTC